MFKAEFLVFGMLLAFTLAYDTTYDDFDYEGMLKNERLVKNLVECLLSDEECANPVFQEVKSKSRDLKQIRYINVQK